ncbi:MAG: hypothetical protein JW867_04400, partial [Candidatus Omnitrophica bacterium]|nr:hypothetical protein [Candidatus Omnitrophota bacterium]
NIMKADNRITLDFKDIDIIEALKYLSEKAKFNIIPTSSVQGRVTLMVDQAPIDDVFHIMLRSNGLAFDKRGEIYNVMTEEEYLALYGKNFYDVRQVKTFQLQYAVPSRAFELADMLKSEVGKIYLNLDSASLLIMDTPEKINEVEKALDSLESKNTTIEVFDIKYAEAKEVAEQLKSHIDVKKVGYVRADTRTNQVIVQTLPARIPEIEKLIRELDHKTREVLVEVRIIRLTVNDSLSKGVEWEGLFQVASEHGMSYIGSYPFSAVQAATDAWRSRLTTLEGGLAPDNTEIIPVDYVGSYPFSGTTVGDINYNSSKPITGAEAMHVGLVGHHDFDVIFKYLKTVGEVRLVATPKITVTNNQEARVHIGERQAYITNTTTQTSSATTISEDVTFVDVGIQLNLTPTINDEGFVTFKINPEISNVSSYLTTSEGNRIPIINTSSTQTTVMVKDAATIMIGGLKEERDTKEGEEVPFFSRIPLLGNIFKKSNTSKYRNELLLLITPHIIEGDELTTGYARDFGYKLDKEDQGYLDIVEEKFLENHKSYRDYSKIKEEADAQDLEPPEIKPMREVEY